MINKCSFCESEAVAIYFMDKGCIVFPNKYVQYLCWHHEQKSTPLNEMLLIIDLRKYNE